MDSGDGMTKVLTIQLLGEEAMVAFGQRLGAVMNDGVIFLEGDLGTGKTTLCRGILRSRGHQGAVKSPTFTLVEPYDFDSGPVFHFDLYRLVDSEELEYMGIRDYFQPANLCLVEWPEKGAGFLPEADLQVSISVEGSGRTVVIMPLSGHGQRALALLGAD